MVDKSNLDTARKVKQDEFYTLYDDIKTEIKRYKNQLENKIVICPCSDRKSQFFHFLNKNFSKLQLQKLIAVGYKNRKDGKGSVIIVSNNKTKKIKLKGSGDCFSPEVVNYIIKSDIVVTNPPFSLFDEFLKLLFFHKKKFLILGPLLTVGHRNIFPFVKNNKLTISKYLSFIEFSVPDYYEEKSNRFRIDENGNKFRSFGNICWFTNLQSDKEKPQLELTAKYNKNNYPIYDNKTDAIEVSKVCNIPSDYYGIMGVPITFLDKYCPTQFKIIGFRKGDDGKDLRLNGKSLFSRILIQRLSESGYSKYSKEYKEREKHNPLIQQLFPPLPKNKFEIIYADPPWDYGGKMQYDKSANKKNNNDYKDKIFISSAKFYYPTMKLSDLKNLQIQKIANSDNCLLFMWTTGPMLEQAIELGTYWGFEYKTVAFVWDKQIHNPGRYTLSQTEFVLVFKMGKIPLPRGARNVRQLISIKRSNKHSEKPLSIIQSITEMFPEHNKIELFARNKYKGWTSWGLDANS